MDLKSLSSNWKRLQRQLDKDKQPKKRNVSLVEDNSSSTQKRMKLSTSTSLSDIPRRTQQNPADLELWALENDIPVVDLRDAYGTIPKRSSSVPTTTLTTDQDNINNGLSAKCAIILSTL
jgi:hypothetical protein